MRIKKRLILWSLRQIRVEMKLRLREEPLESSAKLRHVTSFFTTSNYCGNIVTLSGHELKRRCMRLASEGSFWGMPSIVKVFEFF
jgi:hypothetical protein